MPPKRVKIDRDGKLGMVNPRVILQPLRTDSSGHSRCQFTSEPPVASLFNKPELSDIKLIVADNSFYAHRLVLCAASEVFSKMFGSDWLESKKTELVLREEVECVKVFDQFLEYCYTGSIEITESNTIPLFMLADKYNIKPLYDECVKDIETWLKVYVVSKSHSLPAPKPSTSRSNFPFIYGNTPGLDNWDESPESSHSDSDIDSGSEDSRATIPTVPRPSEQYPIDLVAVETFPLTLVMKMLTFCHNERISSAALYNLQARLASQIKRNNYGVWNDLDQKLLLRILSDDYFCCSEYILFKAAKSWLLYEKERQAPELVEEILSCIRYPILGPDELYTIEKDQLIKTCDQVGNLVREAIRFKLFKHCPNALQNEEWSGKHFHSRQVKKS